MTFEEALESLHFDGDYIDIINANNSEALICIVKKDLNGLKECLDFLKEWRKDNDDLRFPKQDYQEAMEYFIKKFEKESK